jgi:hypothetical protein
MVRARRLLSVSSLGATSVKLFKTRFLICYFPKRLLYTCFIFRDITKYVYKTWELLQHMWSERQFDDPRYGGGEDPRQLKQRPPAPPRFFKMTSRGLLIFLLLTGACFTIINFVLLNTTKSNNAPTTSKRIVAEIVHRGFFDDEQVHLLMNSYARLVPDDCEQHVGFEYDKQYNFSIFTLNSLCELNK